MLLVQEFFDKPTSTLTYVVFDPTSLDALIIDPVLDFDPASGKISFESMNLLTNFIEKKQLKVHFVLETHAHADHISSSRFLKQHFKGLKVGIGAQIVAVQAALKKILNFGNEFNADGRQFDLLFRDGEAVSAGAIKFKVLATPGHTPACVSYLFDDAVFTGDALFMPDFGTGRCDFPLGSAADLFRSISEKIYSLSSRTKTYTGHDYQPQGRPLKFQSTVGEQRETNIHLKANTKPAEFIEFRNNRDRQLPTPKLLFPSIQINITAGNLPKPETNGVSYLKFPIELAHRGHDAS